MPAQEKFIRGQNYPIKWNGDWLEKLKEVDTENVEPLTTMSHEINVLREDEVKEHLSHERALKNAPKKDSDYFRVPKVLD